MSNVVKREEEIIKATERTASERQLMIEKLQKKERLLLMKERIVDRIPDKFIDADIRKTPKEIQQYYADYDETENSKGLYLFGPVGTGKTYSVNALAIELLKNSLDVRIFDLPVLLDQIRSSFSNDSQEIESRTIRDLSDIEVLIIDDIGVEKITDWVLESLYKLINTRYENSKTTIFTSNHNLGELASRTNDRITSRITEMCKIIEVKGKDKRKSS